MNIRNSEGQNLNSVQENNGPFWPQTERLLDLYKRAVNSSELSGEISTIHVDEIASKIAFVYERIRKIIDWKEENLLRRSAIERILKRRLAGEISGIKILNTPSAKDLAEPLLLELIRGGHFPNDKVPRNKIGEIEKILEKYFYILKKNPLFSGKEPIKVKERINLVTWIIEIAACEIEETIDPSLKENAIINFMIETMEERIKIDSSFNLSEEEKKIQILIAVHHALFHLDSALISFKILKFLYPQWGNPSLQFLNETSYQLTEIVKKIDGYLEKPISGEFHKICEKYDTVYLILYDVLEKLTSQQNDISTHLIDEKRLTEEATIAYQKRISTLKNRLIKAAIYSTLSIFVAGIVSLFIVEVPLASLFYGKWSPFAMLIDIALPTIVMFALVIAIKVPGEENLQRVIKEVKGVVYRQARKDIYEIRPKRKTGILTKIIISFLYLITSVLSLFLTFWVFYITRIPPTSIFLDTANMAMIVFAAILIRQKAKEMTIEEKVTFWEFFLDMLSIPVGKVGQWLSKKWKEYNIASIFMTALVDLPFSSIVDFVENWSSFLKEKKAEIQQ